MNWDENDDTGGYYLINCKRCHLLKKKEANVYMEKVDNACLRVYRSDNGYCEYTKNHWTVYCK